MFATDVNYKALVTSHVDEVSYSDVENVAVSPEDNRLNIVSVEESPVDDTLSEKEVRNDEIRSWTMEKVHVGYDVTRKGERSLVIDGFKFTKSRGGTNNRVFWRCSRRECKATAVTVSDRVEHVRAIHGHEPPLAAEFFGSHEGVSHNCELQEVRFNRSASNMRPRYRRTNLSLSESNPDESITVKDISNSPNHFRHSTSATEKISGSIKPETIFTQYKVQNIEIKPTCQLQNTQHKSVNSVKDQVRDFILRNSTQTNNNNNNAPQNNGIAVAKLLISPANQSRLIHGNNTNNMVSSSSCNHSTSFSFNPMNINAVSSNGYDSAMSDNSSHKSRNLPNVLRSDSPVKSTTTNETNIQHIIQILLKNGTYRQRSTSDSDWSSPTPGPDVQQFDFSHNSPSAVTGVPDGYQASAPSRFVHWKKEKIRESESCDQLNNDRKRRYDDCNVDPLVKITSTQSSADSDTKQLFSFLTSFRPTITKKLIAVIQKLTSELCPEQAVAQEVFEKCTAIKTCLETLEKFHSMTSSV